MQDAQMLRTQIYQAIPSLPLEGLQLIADMIDKITAWTRSQMGNPEPAEPMPTLVWDDNTPLKAKVVIGIQHVTHPVEETQPIEMDWDSWLADMLELDEEIAKSRNGTVIDTTAMWESLEADWEEHDNKILGT